MAGSEKQLYIIAYDIPHDRRRSKVHNLLSSYGSWTQYSLFECWLSKRQFLELQAKLQQHLDETTDSLRFYPLCRQCQGNTITIGSAPPKEPVSLFG